MAEIPVLERLTASDLFLVQCTHQIEGAGHAAPFDATSNFVHLIATTITSEQPRTLK